MNLAGRDAQPLNLVGCFEVTFAFQIRVGVYVLTEKEKQFPFIGSAIILRKSNVYFSFVFCQKINTDPALRL